MAYFTELDSNNTVLRVLSVLDHVIPFAQDYLANTLGLGGTWVQTSYNGSIRKQFAGVGYTYDSVADVFIVPQPYPSWALDANHDWQPPTPMPVDGKLYAWQEITQQWSIV